MNRKEKPQLSFIHIWNMCFGFLGIQFGFALQNANMSRIFQTLGAEIYDIAGLWVAAPLTGLVVQPIVGYFSDNLKSRFGRRRPFFFVGAVLSTIALLFMPNSPTLWVAAGTLWILDASINITMEPFRAYVGDMLPNKQRSSGYLMQSFFIGVGAVVASSLPWVLSNWFGMNNTAPEGVIPNTVRYSFYLGAAVLFFSVMWTVFSSREYTDEELHAFHGDESAAEEKRENTLTNQFVYWLFVGGVFSVLIYVLGWERELYILSVGMFVYGLFLSFARYLQNTRKTGNAFFHIVYDLNNMPKTMQKLSVVQFFSWFALFTMWIYTVPAVTSFHFEALDTTGKLYNDGADWVGVLFGAYNGFAAVAAIGIAALANRIGPQLTHIVCLVCGALGFLSFVLIKNPSFLIVSMVGVGIAWASILSLPYAMLANNIPQNRMGLYMGIFNFFIVIPQLLAASVMGLVIKEIFKGEAIYALTVASGFWILAALVTFKIKLED